MSSSYAIHELSNICENKSTNYVGKAWNTTQLSPFLFRSTWVRLCYCLHILVVFVLFMLSITCFHFVNSVLWCLLRFPRKNDAHLVFTSTCFIWSLCFIYINCIHLHFLVSSSSWLFLISKFLSIFSELPRKYDTVLSQTMWQSWNPVDKR